MPASHDLPPNVTLGEARSWLRQRVDKGERCPCCTQFAKVYRRRVTSGAARALIVLYRLGPNYHHAPSTAQLARQGGEIARMSYWGLVQEENQMRPDGGRAGWWRCTDRGRQFIMGEIRIPKYALVYDGRLMMLDGKVMVSIHDALGSKFNLRDLMA